MTDQGEPLDVVCLDFPVCHRPLIKMMEAMGIHSKINRWVDEFLKNITLRVNLGDHHSSEGTVKGGVPEGSVLRPLIFLTFNQSLGS